MAEHTVAAPEVQQPPMTERTRHHKRSVAPPVDSYETRDGLVVLADVPGVAKEALEVRVDHNVLTMRGQARHVIPGEVTYREYDLINSFRPFALSDQVDHSHITADLKCGVLPFHVPKAAEAKPRQIEVRVAYTHGAPWQDPGRSLPGSSLHTSLGLHSTPPRKQYTELLVHWLARAMRGACRRVVAP